MPDSANILSILAQLGTPAQPVAPPVAPIDTGVTPVTYTPPVPAPGDAPITNVLQAAQTPPPAAPVAPVAPPPSPAAPKADEHPKKRQSVLDTIGRIADVLATVGGAQALYQPTLDSREDRALALADHARQVDLDALKKTLTQQQVDAGVLEPQLAARKRIGTALGALANNPNAAELWPSVAAQAGITDQAQIEAIGQQLQRNPNSAGIFAKALGADIDNLGKNVYFGTDGSGKTVAYQVGPDGNPHILDFSAAGVTPSDPIKVVNTGGASVIVGSGGQTKRILPNTEAPGKAQDRASRERIAGNHDRTQITIAGMPARSKEGTGKPGDNAGFIETAQGNLNELKSLYGELHRMGAMVSPAQSKDKNIVARIRASGIGQTLEGAVGTEAQTRRDRINSIRPGLMQSLAKATGMTGKQLDSNADVKLFMATVTDPTKSYEANMEAIAGLERFLRANAKKPEAATPRATPSRPKAKAGWTLVEVK